MDDLEAYGPVRTINRARIIPNSWLDRPDPYFDLEYMGGSTNHFWKEINISKNEVVVNPDGRIEVVKAKAFAPILNAKYYKRTKVHIRIIALMHSFQHASTVQIAAMLGMTVESVALELEELWSYGILFNTEPISKRPEAFGMVWSLNRSSWTLKHWVHGMSTLDRFLMTQGSDIFEYAVGSSSISSARHNVLMLELLIKSMEICPGIAGVWGERWTKGSAFVKTSNDSTKEVLRNSIGDGAIVTKDGKMIVFEMAGKTNISKTYIKVLKDKVSGWAKIASLSNFDLKILFVNTSRDSRLNMERYTEHLRLGLVEAKSGFATSSQMEKMDQSIFYADYKDWFNESRGVYEEFVSLTAVRAADRQKVQLAPTSTPLDRDSNIIMNTSATLFHPRWIINYFEDF